MTFKTEPRSGICCRLPLPRLHGRRLPLPWRKQAINSFLSEPLHGVERIVDGFV